MRLTFASDSAGDEVDNENDDNGDGKGAAGELYLPNHAHSGRLLTELKN